MSLRFKYYVAFRYPSLSATLWILGPTFRNIKPAVNQGMVFAIAQVCKYPNLTIVDFSKAPAPLALYSNRCVSFFYNASLVY